MMAMRRPQGFTLVEMLVVVVIVSVLATIALPLAEITRQREREHQLNTRLRQLRDALDRYKQLTDEGRILRRADESGYPKSLDALVQGVPDARSPERKLIYLLRKLPRDPFADPGIREAARTWRTRSYDSSPDAPRPGRDVFDVMSSSDRIGLNGVPYREW